MSIKQFNTWIKQQHVDEQLAAIQPHYAAIMQSVLADVIEGNVKFRPVEGTNLKQFIQNRYYQKADIQRKLAMEALFVTYQHYYFDTLNTEAALRNGLH